MAGPAEPGLVQSIDEAFRDLATWSGDTSPLYERLCTIVAEDEALQAVAARVPDDRSTANVFLAAVHYLLLRGADGTLAEYYPSVTEETRQIDDDLPAALREFCESHEDDLVPLLERRRTQTNAVRRCVALYPGSARVAADAGEPIALVELGPSAGLNLLWDRYRYDYDGRVVGAADAPVTIETSLEGIGHPPLPESPPEVHSRVGVDLNPMDVTDGTDVDWLRALTWPEHHDRRRVLEGAIEVAKADPPRLVEGDMVEDLPEILAEIPEDVPVVVFSTLVLYQVPESVREEMRDLLAERMSERPLHWLSGDEEYGDSDGITLTWTRAVDGDLRTDLAAVFQQHGEWVDWRYESA